MTHTAAGYPAVFHILRYIFLRSYIFTWSEKNITKSCIPEQIIQSDYIREKIRILISFQTICSN